MEQELNNYEKAMEDLKQIKEFLLGLLEAKEREENAREQ